MPEEKIFNTRLVNKHDIEENWAKAINFVPKQGELIVYDIDDNYTYERFKIGDGVTKVSELSFLAPQADWNQNDENAPDYVKNRTHYAERLSVTYDDSASYPVRVDIETSYGGSSISSGVTMVKISDLHPSLEEMLSTGVMTTSLGNAAIEENLVHNITDAGYTVVWSRRPKGTISTYLAVVHQAGYVVCDSHNVDTGEPGNSHTGTLREPGLYVAFSTSSPRVSKVEWDSVKLLDEKYIPSTIARVSDIPDAIAVDPTLTIEGAAADAKVVGDLWNNLPTDADVWETLINIGLYERIADESGNVLTDEANAILLI